MKAKPIEQNGMVIGHAIFCPGCKCGHVFDHRWHFNGNLDKPTFGPLPSGGSHSMLVNQDDPGSRCHSYVENGKIRFLSDCWHALKGQTVELEDYDEPAPTETAPEIERVEPLSPDGGQGGASSQTQERNITMRGKFSIEEVRQRAGSRQDAKGNYIHSEVRVLTLAPDFSGDVTIHGTVELHVVNRSVLKEIEAGTQYVLELKQVESKAQIAARVKAEDAAKKKAAEAKQTTPPEK